MCEALFSEDTVTVPPVWKAAKQGSKQDCFFVSIDSLVGESPPYIQGDTDTACPQSYRRHHGAPRMERFDRLMRFGSRNVFTLYCEREGLAGVCYTSGETGLSEPQLTHLSSMFLVALSGATHYVLIDTEERAAKKYRQSSSDH
jgi:hypothetical protein